MTPIAEGIYTDADWPRLLSGRGRGSGRIVFPCPPGNLFEPVPLSREGTVWSFTIQRFRPKTPPYAGPEDFEPYAVAYVELPGEVIVEARLVDVAFDAIKIGMPVTLKFIPFTSGQGGAPVMIHAFAPVKREQVT